MRYAVLGLVFLAASCQTTTLPNSPTRLIVPTPVVTPPATGEAATLELTTFTLGTPEFNNGWYFYYPQFEVRETTGHGSAAVTSIEYTEPGGDRFIISGRGCLMPSTVAPGSTWSINAVGYYCQDVDVQTPIASLTLTVGYTDSAGHAKTVSGVSK